MSLPKIDTPIYEVTLPFSKKTLRFRPFLVKEQKILMMALESKQRKTIENAIKQIVNNCSLDDIDVDTVPLIDLEYYFYTLRARSIGESIESKYKCQNNISEDKVCGNTLEVSFNILTDITFENEEINNVIKITDTIGIQFKYPDLTVVNKIENNDSLTDITFDLIANTIDFIYDENNVYYAHETKHEELISFLEALTQKQFEEVCSYFKNLPSLKTTKEVTCSKCGFIHKIEVEGLESFFH